MPFRAMSRRAGAIGMAMTVYDIWRRLPPQQRRQVMILARKHGPTVASRIVQRRPRPKP